LHLDANSLVDFQSDDVIRLLGGRVRLSITSARGTTRRVSYRVDAPTAWVQIVTSGEYRISIVTSGPESRDSDVELAVLRGAAELVNEDGRTSLAAGERAFARSGSAPSNAYVFNSAAWDAFDRWSEARRDARLGVSAEYLPETVQSYSATFNDYGSWRNEPTYGYVWYPRVAVGWRPYYYGRWTSLRPWGWTWIGSDPWAWPTHHYGRWGYSAGAWFWIPGRTWGPAWVSWAYAPGYVSWCPLGWNNRAVFGFSVGVYGGYSYNPWNAWTVVPYRGFGRGYVNANVVHSRYIDHRTRGAFVVRDAGPNVTGYAVPRSNLAIRSVGARTQLAPREGSAAGVRTARPGAAPAGDATSAFRSRRSSSSEQAVGSGYPTPSREPRASATWPTRQAPSRTAAPSTNTAPSGRSAVERRAVPRESNVAPAPTDAAPSRRAAPEYRAPASSAPNSRSDAYAPNSRSDRYRAVPRTQGAETPSAREYGVYAPSNPSSGAAPERSYRTPMRSAPERTYQQPSNDNPYSGRATPRSAPSDGGYRAPESYRSRPGPERSAPAPSSPPPQAAPASRSYGPPSSNSGGSGSVGGGQSRSRSGGESRSGSGGQSTGRAVPRGGRG
jgi:hypothetical protein